MNPIKIVSISLLTFAIVACGGGGSPSTSTATTAATEEITGAVTVGTPNIGRGSAETFEGNLLAVQIPTLSAGGITNISASVVDITKSDALISSQSYAVIFSSNCEGKTPAKASFTPKTVITTTGEISTSYKALGCAGDDAITATLYNASGTPAIADTSTALALATGALTVENAEVGAVGFVSNSAAQLGFAGVGNGALPSTSTVIFNVKDNFGNPLESKDVTFALSSTSAGASLSSAQGVTDADGNVSTTLNAGTTHGLLSVVASTTTNAGVVINTASTPVSVAIGLAEQSNFEIVAANYNPFAWDFSGTTVDITVFASDHFHNPIPVGTTIHFTAESGIIPATCVTSELGGCTVQWTSAATRPGDYSTGLGSTKNDEYLPPVSSSSTIPVVQTDVKGFTTITAYALGEGGFTDKNSNGVFDIGESFLTFPEAFRDDNYNGIYENGAKTEEFFQLIPGSTYSGAPTMYQGALCSQAAKDAGHCANLVHVRDSLRIVQSAGFGTFNMSYYTRSGSFPNYTYTLVTDVTAPATVYAVITDKNGNIPPATTKFGFTIDNATDFKVVSSASEVSNSDGVFPRTWNHPLNRGFEFKIEFSKTGTPTQTVFRPTVDFATTKNKSISGDLIVR
jgi:hypothetical protein